MTPALDLDTLMSALRAATVGAPAKLLSKIVEIGPHKFEVRQPTVAARSEIMRLAEAIKMGADGKPEMGRDFGLLLIQAAIACVFLPGSDRHVFTKHDVAAMKEAPSGGFVDVLGKAALDLLNVEGPAEGKDSGKDPSGN